ncbi:hypothetical protein PJN38_12675 [Mycobacterium kansasii]|uniref:Plasmid replication, integration and excision activator n=2 Tax=Mycobacterium TaxID=1763 RepID=A0A1A3KGJ6_MYCAS|nr:MULTISPECIES: hypothetical protein [Mycobacterium]MCQ4365617.1 hypothetical protein [Mycobacterium gordonae]MXO39618.1 hypothetical protein [Mycobacterium kansasii]OBJ83539.1 hypothetical protein A5640_18410 [Mycobacterium asiaticum]POX86500.1 hypothetical protein C3B43_19585 [Mycobacterium kansasii]POY05995.1 hypothetical protein C3477_11965 [Mycobacterium kansasii]
MAIQKGHRFPMQHTDAFPRGLMLLGPIGPDMEFERPNVQKADPATGLRQWAGAVSDPDEPKAKRASFVVTFLAEVQPVPSTPELVAGSGIRMIELEGLTAEPRRMGQGEYTYVGYVYRATGIKGDVNSPAPVSKSSSAPRGETVKAGA